MESHQFGITEFLDLNCCTCNILSLDTYLLNSCGALGSVPGAKCMGLNKKKDVLFTFRILTVREAFYLAHYSAEDVNLLKFRVR